jgi:glycosyltransferase involved in cell wall biosynthesis
LKPVVHVITTLGRGGAETQLRILAREQVKSGRRVVVIFLKDKPELLSDFSNANIEVSQLLWNLNPFQQVLRLRRLLNSDSYLVHAHLPRAQLIAALATKKSNMIISRHDEDPFFPHANKIISLTLSRYVAYKSKVAIAISSAVKNKMVASKEFPTEFPIEVVHYGFDEHMYSVTSMKQIDELKESLGVAEALIFGTVARLVPQKDFPTLLKGFKLLCDSGTNAKLVIAGDGPLRKELMNLCFELKITPNVLWLGSRSDVQLIYSLMDVFVLASKTEGFGLVLLEAMSNSLPIVGSNIPTVQEVLGPNVGLAFETGNPIDLFDKLLMCTSDELRNSLSEQSKIRIRNFDPIRMRARIDEIYDYSGAQK